MCVFGGERGGREMMQESLDKDRLTIVCENFLHTIVDSSTSQDNTRLDLQQNYTQHNYNGFIHVCTEDL